MNIKIIVGRFPVTIKVSFTKYELTLSCCRLDREYGDNCLFNTGISDKINYHVSVESIINSVSELDLVDRIARINEVLVITGVNGNTNYFKLIIKTLSASDSMLDLNFQFYRYTYSNLLP
jgi:hypothetical protein